MAAAACAPWLPPGILFSPEDEVAVGHYLLPRLQGSPLPIDGLILYDDPLSAPPWELLERNGRKEQAFFFAEGKARCGKGTRQRRTCTGGGWWEGQKTCAEGDMLPVPGGMVVAAWRKKAFNFHSGSGGGDGKRSKGWVMHEYAVTGLEDLASSPLRLYHIRLSSYGRKQCGAMELPPALGFLPGFVFAPEDSEVVVHYLLPFILGQPLPLDGLIVDDDPLSAPPWELLERNGRREDAFFFALGQAKSNRGSRQKRTCVGGGFWNGEKTCVDGEKLCFSVPGGMAEVAWRKKALSFQEGGGGGEKGGSTGWVMHEYAITAPDHLGQSQLRLYRIRFSGHGKKRKQRGDGDSCGDEPARNDARRRRVAEDADALPHMSSPQSQLISSSSTVLIGHNCINGADHHHHAAPAVTPLAPGVVDTNCDSLGSIDTDELFRFVENYPSTSRDELPAATTGYGAHLEADDGAGSSFLYQTMATAPPCSAVDTGAPVAPMNMTMMHHGCMEPIDSAIFFTAPLPNQYMGPVN